MAQIHLFHNPVAGKGRARAALPAVLARFRNHGLEPELHVTEGPGDASRLAALTGQDDTLIAMGGDGTVQEVAAVCAHSGRKLGLIPSGSGDDFAYALGIDRHDHGAAVDVIAANRTRTVDSGIANGRRFINAAGTGFDAEVARAALSAPWPLRERAAYLYAIVASLSRLASAHCRITLDGKQAYDGDALLVSAQNGPRTGGSFPFSPTADIADGILDVMIAGDFGRAATLAILPRLLAGSHLSHPRVQLLRGRELTIEWHVPRPLHLEGELQEACGRFDIRIEPASLEVFCP